MPTLGAMLLSDEVAKGGRGRTGEPVWVAPVSKSASHSKWVVKAFNPDQPRDDHGRWGTGTDHPADKASAAAGKATFRADKSGRPEDHESAMNAHDKAMRMHMKLAQNMNEYHDSRALDHMDAARAHMAQSQAHFKKAQSYIMSH